jgi:hypothetical protein
MATITKECLSGSLVYENSGGGVYHVHKGKDECLMWMSELKYDCGDISANIEFYSKDKKNNIIGFARLDICNICADRFSIFNGNSMNFTLCEPEGKLFSCDLLQGSDIYNCKFIVDDASEEKFNKLKDSINLRINQKYNNLNYSIRVIEEKFKINAV